MESNPRTMKLVDVKWFLKAVKREDYEIFHRLISFIAITGAIGHLIFYLILNSFDGFVESILLRSAAIAIFLSYLFLKSKSLSRAKVWYFELSWAFVMLTLFNVFLIINEASTYWAASLIFAAVTYGAIAQPLKALFLYPISVVPVLFWFYLYGASDVSVIKTAAILNIPGYFLVYAIGGVQAITKSTYAELQQTKIKLVEVERLATFTRVFEKFVPKQFISKISSGDISTIEFGKAKTEVLTVLFSDIRNFTTISEKFPPQELLDQLNIHFKKMSSIIHDHNGFIDKFIGDEIMALFDGETKKGVENALDSAIRIQKAQGRYNQWALHHKAEFFNVGVGLHTGEVVIGTVGSVDRMDSTVLGDVVNVGARLESLTSYYGVGIVVSSSIKNFVSENVKYHFRELDMVVVKGKSKPEIIFEVVEGGSIEQQKRLLAVLDEYRVGLTLYRSHKWGMALSVFNKCLIGCGKDRVLDIYIERCEKYIKQPPDEFWSPAINFNL